jgi:hypothetical protein
VVVIFDLPEDLSITLRLFGKVKTLLPVGLDCPI